LELRLLTTDFEHDEVAITVPYKAVSDEVRQNHGFVDLRGQVDLATKILEGIDCAPLQRFLVDLAHPESEVFSVGCDVGEHRESQETGSYVAGGYVQLVSNRYADLSPDQYLEYANHIAMLVESASAESNWRLRFIHQFVAFKLDKSVDLISSLAIWFYGAADSRSGAYESREKLIEQLRNIVPTVFSASGTHG